MSGKPGGRLYSRAQVSEEIHWLTVKIRIGGHLLTDKTVGSNLGFSWGLSGDGRRLRVAWDRYRLVHGAVME